MSSCGRRMSGGRRRELGGKGSHGGGWCLCVKVRELFNVKGR